MKLVTRCVAGAVLFAVCTVPGLTPAGAGGPMFLRAIPSSAAHCFQAPHIHLRTYNQSASASLNWSGYAIETNLSKPASNAVSDIVGGWTVPAAVASTPTKTTYSSAWVGIDGYSTDTVEQIGTEQDWTSKGASYYAWFEMYPNGGYEIVNFPVAPGNLITAQVKYTGAESVVVKEGRGRRTSETTEVYDTFQLTITNVTRNVSFTTSEQVESAERASAEWIMEAPSENSVLPLTDFGVVDFFGCEATVDGVTGTIGDTAWQYDALTMETSAGVAKAVPSALTSEGSAFTVTWKHQ